MALLVYKQTLTLPTKKWNVPRRKDGNKWIPIEYSRSLSLIDRHDGSLRGAIIKMKDKMEKMGIWKCSMSSAKSGNYRVYTLVCKRQKQCQD